jgi:hypothetical protein
MKLCTKSGHYATYGVAPATRPVSIVPVGVECWRRNLMEPPPTRLAERTSQRCVRPSEAPTSLQETYEAFAVDDVMEAAELDRCSMISRCTTWRAVLQSGVRRATSASNAAGLLWRAVTWSTTEAEARAAPTSSQALPCSGWAVGGWPKLGDTWRWQLRREFYVGLRH